MSSTVAVSSLDDANEEIVVGPAFTGFLDKVAPEAARDTITSDATSILSSARVRKDERCNNVGLVVGRIQSGKTVSYEALIALSRDNGFSLVVVLSGISKVLLRQGHARLTNDLNKADPTGWLFFTNADLDPINESTLKSVRENWADPNTPAKLKKTAVCVLLKHHGRIDSFTALCNEIGWSNQKVLIIDDEADQASLNTDNKSGLESPTYRNILELRNAFPHHAYLQYTATPQAPLLIAITDALSPNFVRVIDPGPNYAGGREFFGQPNRLVTAIPSSDIEALDLNIPSPPDSLVKAFIEFLIGAAHSLAADEGEVRSMLIHPSRTTDRHERFVNWIRKLRELWSDVISNEDQAEIIDIRDKFKAVHDELAQTSLDISNFDDCWGNLKFVLRNIKILEMNTRDKSIPEFDWIASTAYVLVGGQAIDRGFTVEGLTVTYMPRDPGNRTIDSIQQKARFFGYKGKYIGFCRIHLRSEMREIFNQYVEHEQVMIKTLREISEGQLTLREWRRSFLLDPGMKATRSNVIAVPTVSVRSGEKWIFDARTPNPGSSNSEAAEALRSLLGRFEPELDIDGHLRVSITVQELLEILESLPSEFDSRTTQMTALELNLARLIDLDPSESVEFMWMRAGATDAVRSVTNNRVQPFQGRSGNYSGDREQFAADMITVQAHAFGVRQDRNSEVFASRLVLAFRLPQRLAKTWLVEGK